MKAHHVFLPAFLGISISLFTGCKTTDPQRQGNPSAVAATGHSKADGKSVAGKDEDLDEYDVTYIPDPLEPLNRGTFWVNHQLYVFVLKPVSKTYEKVIPKPVRTGIYNVFDNVEFPVRFVNNALQGNFQRVGQETGKFLVNTTLGVGGIMRQSDKFPALADVPDASTGQTFAKWGIGHGAYLVLPVIGPSSLRDTVGLAGDYGLNPITWVGIFYGYWAWTIPVAVVDTVSVMPDKFSQYDAVTKNTLDRYLAARSAYVQSRRENALK